VNAKFLFGRSPRDVLVFHFRLNNLLQEIGNNGEPGAKIIIFVETKKKVESITRTIRRYGWPAVCMHGDKSQQERDFVLREFRNGKSCILIATDVAARGLGRFLIWFS
jgi:ATP-dependent RNA helicase DDX5/DBP2